MDQIYGKHFSIMDPQNVSTVIYQINRNDTDPRFTLERLKSREEIVGENGNQLIILSFGKDKVVVNSGVLSQDEVKISRKPTPAKYNTLYSEKETEYKDINYTPNLQRPITIIDPETTEEIKPILYFDKETNEVKGKCKLKPYKSYFAFEIRQDNN